MQIGQQDLESYIRDLISKDELWRFYKTDEWIQLKESILKENHYECAECRKSGRITRYDIDEDGAKRLLSTVHHVQHVRKHPRLALSRTYTYQGETHMNLIPVCKSCHNKLHPEKSRKKEDKFTGDEQW